MKVSQKTVLFWIVGTLGIIGIRDTGRQIHYFLLQPGSNSAPRYIALVIPGSIYLLAIGVIVLIYFLKNKKKKIRRNKKVYIN